MFSYPNPADPPFSSATYHEPAPLHPGQYVLVDISEAIESFYTTPPQVRMHLLGETGEMTEYDMLDVELTEIVPCINDVFSTDDELTKHVEHLLDEGVEHIVAELTEQGYDVEQRHIPNTTEQIEHAQAVFEFGHHLHRLFKQHGLYSDDKELVGEYHTLLEDGLLVLRRR